MGEDETRQCWVQIQPARHTSLTSASAVVPRTRVPSDIFKSTFDALVTASVSSPCCVADPTSALWVQKHGFESDFGVFTTGTTVKSSDPSRSQVRSGRLARYPGVSRRRNARRSPPQGRHVIVMFLLFLSRQLLGQSQWSVSRRVPCVCVSVPVAV